MAESITYVAIWAQLLPIAALLLLPRPIAREFVLTGLVLSISLAVDGAMMWLGSRGINTLWLIHAGLPVMTALILWSLSYFQLRLVPRDALRIAAGLYAVVWLVMTAAVEDVTQFSRFTAPLQALVVIAAAAYTLLSRLRHSSVPATTPWFWISIAWLLYFGSGAVLDPVSDMMLEVNAIDHLRGVFYVKAGIDIIAFGLLTLGVLCGRSSLRFGGSISPPPAPLRSSS